MREPRFVVFSEVSSQTFIHYTFIHSQIQNYMAPEVLDIVRRFEMSGDASDGGDGGPEFYTCLADCWSLGEIPDLEQ